MEARFSKPVLGDAGEDVGRRRRGHLSRAQDGDIVIDQGR
jgi:hypothetical protein